MLVTNWKKSSYTEFLDSTRYLFGTTSSLRSISSTHNSSDHKQTNSGNLKALCLRCASEATYQITSFNIEAVAYILRVDDDKGPVGTFIEPLQLMHSKNVVFVSRECLCSSWSSFVLKMHSLLFFSINLVQHTL